MKPYVRLIAVILGTLFLTGALLAVPRKLAASYEDSPAPAADVTYGHNLAPKALRAISIPFGVTNTLRLSIDGREIHIVGHAECPAEMERFSVQAIAAQDAPGAYGSTPFTDEFDCTAVEQAWETTLTAQDSTSFEEGAVWLCVTSLFFPAYGESGIFRWCYDEVVLETEQPEQEAHLLLPLVTSSLLDRVAELWQLFQ